MKHQSTIRRRRAGAFQPKLRFSPWAWAKLLFLRNYGPTEVGGFGISSARDLLFVEDLVLIRQRCSPVTVVFDDMAVAEFFDDQIDRGRRPEEFGRIWIHTHPGNSPYPSAVDEETFSRVFGRSDWSVMAILACGGDSYARLQFSAGPGGSSEIPTTVDFDRPFGATDWDAWEQEYLTHVTEEPSFHEELLGDLAPSGRDVTPFPEFSSPLPQPIPGEFDDRPIFTAARPHSFGSATGSDGNGDRRGGDR